MIENSENRDFREEENNREVETNNAKKTRTSNRGFASMDPELQRQIASKGGKAAHQQGVAHRFNSEEAREAGRKGGEAVSRDREHMAEIGRRGGEASHSGGRNSNNGGRNEEVRTEE